MPPVTHKSKDRSPRPPKAAASPNRRIYFLAAFLLVWIIFIGMRLLALQVGRYGEFTQRAARQQRRTIDVAPRRGAIYDRNGRELAMTINVDSVFAVPAEIPDHGNAAALIARVLRAHPREILAKLESSKNFVWVARKLDANDSRRLRELNLKGIYFQKESKRFYPKRELAAQVLGFVGMDDEGLGGIEKKFDEQLRGKPGKMLVSVDARRRSLGRAEKQPEAGGNLILTLDEKIQYIAERELARAIQDTGAEAGTVIIQVPQTGEVLALASWPAFDPNKYRSAAPQRWKNRAVSDVHEPGSTFKIITVAAALEEKLTRAEEVIDCQNGSITIFGHRIRDHKPFGMLTVSQVMQQSSDVGAIKLGLRLGNERFDDYIRAFGFGAPTGIELPGETRGLVKPASRWSKVSVGAISMGQEIGVSSVQVVSMVSAIATDGVYTAPRIVAGIAPPQTRPSPQRITFQPGEQRRVVSPMTAVQLKRMLEDTVLFGTGKKAILDGYTSAGKTGTAQKIDPRTGRYSSWAHIASFAGFAPVNKPAISMLVSLDSPRTRGLHHGGDVAAPVWGRIAQQVLAFMNVPHDVEVQNAQRLQIRAAARPEQLSEGSPDRLSEFPEFAEADVVTDTMVSQKPSPVVASVPTPVQAQRARVLAASFTPLMPARREPRPLETLPPAPVSKPSASGTIVLDTEGTRLTPSFLGKSVRGAIEMAQREAIEIDVIGSGVAREQSPAAREAMPPGARVRVRFAR